MAILVIDLSYQSGTIFACDAKGKLISILPSTEYRCLPTAIDNFLKSLNLNLLAIAIPSGPGAFTPLRVGASTALAICKTLELPLISYPSFLGALENNEVEGKIFLDARSDLCFSANFKRTSDNLIEIDNIELVQATESIPYKTNTELLGQQIALRWEKNNFCPLNKFQICYIKQPT